MMVRRSYQCLLVCALTALALPSGCTKWPGSTTGIIPEQTVTDVRLPEQLAPARIPDSAPPETVANLDTDTPELLLSLDDAIRVALENMEVVRVLTGVSAVSSGSTIYDVAIANTAIDEQNSVFDPNLSINNNWGRTETPFGLLIPQFFGLLPPIEAIGGNRSDSYNLDAQIAKRNRFGGTGSFGVTATPSRSRAAVLNPQTAHSLTLQWSQPLMRGAGIEPNLAPIMLARIDTERSFFQFKGNVQQLVRSVIDGYWALVQARTDVWVRRQQVLPLKEAYDRAVARMERGLADAADVSQTRAAFASFRASLIGAEAELINREAALRNLLGLPPTDGQRIVPTTPPTIDRLQFDWLHLLSVSEQHRPDVTELKLVLEADEQQIILADNDAQPNVDAFMLYRWNGLSGVAPSGQRLATGGSDFQDWTLGINFSVPLGLRQGRASVRRAELLVARDRANLDQRMHRVVHELAGALRDLDQAFEQYLAFKENRQASRRNVQQQRREYENGRVIFLNVLQAINDWGNAVSSEAVALTQYNSALARLEELTGTILETHGVRFYEERWGFAGPLFEDRCYPAQLSPSATPSIYESLDGPAEDFFELEDPLGGPGGRRRTTPPVPSPPESSPPPEPSRPLRLEPPTGGED